MKTPAKTKDVTDAPTEVAEISTPAPKSAKKAKTPAKKKDVEEAASEVAEKPTPKPKKDKTPAKPKETPQPAVADTPKPASKATPKSVAKETPKTVSKATPKSAPESAPKETPKPAGKATPKSALKSGAKSAGKATPKSTSKETPKSATKEADETPAPKLTAKQEKTLKKTPAKATPAKATPAKSAKKAAKKAEPEQIVEEQGKIVQKVGNDATAAEEEQASSDEEVDEQTKALVLAVDSGDEDEQASGVITFEQGQDVGTIPDVSKELSKKEKKEKKALKAASSKTKEETGVIYIGRLPHGFYEHEMKNYFSQFGPIRNLRVSRNKKTGRAKHFAFVEFEEASTAEIVAKTMDVSCAAYSLGWR